MRDAEFDAQKERVRALLDKWVPRLGLRWWTMTYEWGREDLAPSSGDPAFWQTAAETSVQWPYLTAKILFVLPAIEAMDDDDVETVVVHELCHVLVAEMQQEDSEGDHRSHVERVVTNLASAFLWTAAEAAEPKPASTPLDASHLMGLLDDAREEAAHAPA